MKKSFLMLSKLTSSFGWSWVLFTLCLGNSYAAGSLDKEDLTARANKLTLEKRQAALAKEKEALQKLLAQKEIEIENLEIEKQTFDEKLKEDASYYKILANDFAQSLSDLRNGLDTVSADYRTNPKKTKDEIKNLLHEIVEQTWIEPHRYTEQQLRKKEKRFNEYFATFALIGIFGSLGLLGIPIKIIDYYTLHEKYYFAHHHWVLTFVSVGMVLSALGLLVGGVLGARKINSLVTHKYFSENHYKEIRENRNEQNRLEPFYEELRLLGYNDIPNEFVQRKDWMIATINKAYEEALQKNPEIEAIVKQELQIIDCEKHLSPSKKRVEIRDEEFEINLKAELEAEEALAEALQVKTKK